MLHGSTSPGGVGSELTRLLASLSTTTPAAQRVDAASASQRPALADRLGHWLSWSGAISLSAALNARAAARDPGRRPTAGGEEADFQRVQAALAASIAAGPREDASSPTDFGPHRRHCIAQQQAMQEAVAALRQRLRDALALRSAAGARLAAIDAVLDQTLAVQERTLLGLVPLRLQAHFEHLQQRAGEGADAAAWLPTFCQARDRLLAAELTHRLLPAQGQLDALLHPSRAPSTP